MQRLSVEELITNLGLVVIGFLAAVITGIALERSFSKQCGDFSGNWLASAIGGSDAPDGVFRLVSDGCKVSGTLEGGSTFITLDGRAERTRHSPHTAKLQAMRRDSDTGTLETMDIEMTLVANGERIFFEIMPNDSGEQGAQQLLLTELSAVSSRAMASGRGAAP